MFPGSKASKITVDEMLGKLWPAMSKAGWKHAKGTGLVSYYYVLPNTATKERKAGVNMFDVENTVEYVCKHHPEWMPVEEPESEPEEEEEKPKAKTAVYEEIEEEKEVVETHTQRMTIQQALDTNKAPLHECITFKALWKILSTEYKWSYRVGKGVVSWNYFNGGSDLKLKGKLNKDYFTECASIFEYVLWLVCGSIYVFCVSGDVHVFSISILVYHFMHVHNICTYKRVLRHIHVYQMYPIPL